MQLLRQNSVKEISFYPIFRIVFIIFIMIFTAVFFKKGPFREVFKKTDMLWSGRGSTFTVSQLNNFSFYDLFYESLEVYLV